MALCNYLFKIYQGFWLNYFDYLFFFIHCQMDIIAEKRWNNCRSMDWSIEFTHIYMYIPPPYEVLYKKHSVGLSVCLSVQICVQPVTSFCFDIGIPCLAHWCITMRWCVVYIHEFSMTLIFDLKVKFKRVFDMTFCPGHSFFVLWHCHTWTVHCQLLGNKCECQGSSDREGVFKFLLAHLSWKLNLSFSDHLSCVVCVFVCLSVCLSVRL